MEYKDIRENLEEISKENYKDFIKALIGIEKSIEDENTLDKIYDEYMDNDNIALLSEEFDYIINKMKNQRKIVEGTNWYV